MPHLVRWYEELSDLGLVVIAANCQDGKPEELKSFVAKFGLRCSLAENVSVGAGGFGLPHMFVFGPDGTCLFEGHPDKADEKVRMALGLALLHKADISSPTKQMTPIADALKKGAAPLVQFNKLGSLKSSSDKATVEQAKALSDGILATAKERLDAAKANNTDDPIGSYLAVVRLSSSMKGTTVATQANELAGKWRNSKPVADELKARQMLDQVKKIEAALRDLAKDGNYADPMFRKMNVNGIKQLQTIVKRMEKDWPMAPSTKEASGLLAPFID